MAGLQPFLLGVRRARAVVLRLGLAAACGLAAARAGLVNYWTFDGNLSDTAGDIPGNTSGSATHMEEDVREAAHVSYVGGPIQGVLALETAPTTGSRHPGTIARTRAQFNGTADVAFRG